MIYSKSELCIIKGHYSMDCFTGPKIYICVNERFFTLVECYTCISHQNQIAISSELLKRYRLPIFNLALVRLGTAVTKSDTPTGSK